MAIVFFEEQKRQQYLIIVFILVTLVTVAVFWFGVFQKPETEIIQLPSSPFSKKVDINFGTLTDPRLEQLELFQEIPPLASGAGRDNPFAP